MAHPIYSFTYPITKKRYYQIWDTFSGYPETIPMDLITLLQYKGIFNKEFVGVLFSIFNRLIATGSTINNDFHSSISKEGVFLQQACIYIEKFEKNDDLELNNLNKKIEALFLSNISFTDFYVKYKDLVHGLHEYPFKQRHYYHSLAHTFSCVSKSVNEIGEHVFENLIKSIATPDGISFKKDKGIMESLDKWFKQGLFFSHQDFFSSLFVALAKKNLIAFDAIPHVLRDNNKVITFFEEIDLQHLLPSNPIIQAIDSIIFEPKLYPFEQFALQYINHAAFDKLGDSSLIGLPIFQMSINQIKEKLDDVYLGVSRLINFTDENGRTLLPMIYSTYFDLIDESSILCLAPFGQQYFHVFTKKGTLIDEDGYYDVFHYNSSVSYFQHMNLINWERISYHQRDNNFKKTRVNLDSFDIENSVIYFEKTHLEDNMEDRNLNKRFSKQPVSFQDKPNNNDFNTSQNDDLPF